MVKRKGRGNAFLRFYLLLLVISVFLTLFYVRERVELVRMGYMMALSEKRKTDLEGKRRTLMLKLAKLKSPQRIQATARQELGFVDPPAVEFIITEDEKSAD